MAGVRCTPHHSDTLTLCASCGNVASWAAAAGCHPRRPRWRHQLQLQLWSSPLALAAKHEVQ